ncbi:MAG: aminotransferase class I/II-fold pyridoxal phosphate-dependent enzyme [Halobacteriales archaeon]|nr:aminotransferase class I/II-fold pyridoxal phosphate-dependent enzyme [Halobacteriales archaeon]
MATEQLPRLASRTTPIQDSKIRYMFDLAEELGGDLVRLEIGIPDFNTPEHVIDAAAEAAHGGATTYTTGSGIPELREAIADRSRELHDLELDPATEIEATVGGMEAIYLAFLTLAEEGSEVIVPSPAWPNYVMMIHLADAHPVEVPLPAEDGFDLDPDLIIEHMSADTDVVVINSPSNPTGRVYDTDDVQAVVEAAADYDAYVIADEVYKSLTFDGPQESLLSLLDYPEHMLHVNSASKQFAMTGWRIGWLAGPEPVMETVAKIHPATVSCAPSISQHAALAAITGPQDPFEDMVEAFRERRDYVAQRASDLSHVDCARPEGAFYAFLDVSAFEGNDLEIAERLAREYGVITAPGSGFGAGGEGFIRLSYANSLERLEEGFDRIEQMIAAELD